MILLLLKNIELISLNFLKKNGLKDISKQDTNLLNFILFPKESKEFYQSKNKLSMNDIIGLQEGFGLYIE